MTVNKTQLDWNRNEAGQPKRTDSGSYVLVKDGRIYLGLYPDDAKQMQLLFAEINEIYTK